MPILEKVDCIYEYQSEGKINTRKVKKVDYEPSAQKGTYYNYGISWPRLTIVNNPKASTSHAPLVYF